MIVPNSVPLDTGDLFPNLAWSLVGGGEVQMPSGLDTPYHAILIYRGHWCSYCRAQLTSYQKSLEKLQEQGIGVIAASVDDEAQAAETVESLGLTFPVAYGLSAEETSKSLGAFYAEASPQRGPFLHSTNFVLGPDGRIIVGLYSTGAVGRLIWQDVVGRVEYARKASQA